MIALQLLPDRDLRARGDEEPVHVVATPFEQWDNDYYVMRCGIEVRVFDDGTVVPDIDWYEPEAAHKATCKGCTT